MHIFIYLIKKYDPLKTFCCIVMHSVVCHLLPTKPNEKGDPKPSITKLSQSAVKCFAGKKRKAMIELKERGKAQFLIRMLQKATK